MQKRLVDDLIELSVVERWVVCVFTAWLYTMSKLGMVEKRHRNRKWGYADEVRKPSIID